MVVVVGDVVVVVGDVVVVVGDVGVVVATETGLVSVAGDVVVVALMCPLVASMLTASTLTSSSSRRTLVKGT